jgi:Xaa-Pro aminopeptidase
MRICQPGMNEVQIEAELIHEFRCNHAVAAYEPIVGGGANACTLHYRSNNAQLMDGDLLLIDAGAEFQSYASDITRTFPINGRFSKEQTALYEVVLAAQAAAIEQARKGRSWIAPHHAAVKVITQGLIDLKILKGSVNDNIALEKYKPFYMHKTGHWIGLDVHDVGDYQIDGEYRVLEAGMVMTVEPGIYITNETGVAEKWHHIGIRIEDDVQVTSAAPLVLTAKAPKQIAEIEALMRK